MYCELRSQNHLFSTRSENLQKSPYSIQEDTRGKSKIQANLHTNTADMADLLRG